MDQQWQTLQKCPACHNPDNKKLGKLAIINYVFASKKIPLPDDAINLYRCNCCGLIYKSCVPTPNYLSSIVLSIQDQLWNSTYDFKSELSAIESVTRTRFYDVLDVGAAGGEFLNRVANGSMRRSALDMVKFERLKLSKTSEFILGLLDGKLEWSGEPYDVVTAFDMMEHLYNPELAIENLRSLTKPGGYIVLETGDTDSIDIERIWAWYYLSLFEHHLAWNELSLKRNFERFGFELISVERKPPKLWIGIKSNWNNNMRLFAHSLSPKIYHFAQRALGFDGSVPSPYGKADHLRMIFRRC